MSDGDIFIYMRVAGGDWNRLGPWQDAGAAGRSAMAWSDEWLEGGEFDVKVRIEEGGRERHPTEDEIKELAELLTGMDEFGADLDTVEGDRSLADDEEGE